MVERHIRLNETEDVKEFVNEAAKCDFDIDISYNRIVIDAKSIFKYSRRHGTKAAAMDGQLTEAVKAQRSEKLLALHDIRAKEYEEAMIGKTIELLIEEEIEEDGKSWYVGHSREYVRAVIEKTDAHQVNDLVEAKVTGFVTDHLLRAE